MADPAHRSAPVPGWDYPTELRAWFSSEEACLDYLDRLRWPEGFRCGHLGSDVTTAGVDNKGRYRCRGCRPQITVTAGTIFDKSRMSLSGWFEAVWLLATNKSGVSATYLYRVLPVGSRAPGLCWPSSAR